ncbi:hypothetical protein OIE71_08865 [Streptomyces sp. NBC_01725]|uniref:hypothetical protein n=1 Tax=unclassified Streptomyces TaxID=2593676 RepID=UPI0011CBD813|nr:MULTISPECIES: hypothetical protein [unclassified Streptomyces]TXL92774.1 hypothetical protein EW053_02045 [Streptomyces sp. IB2014 016-6]
MTYTDPYRPPTGPDGRPDASPDGITRAGVTRTLLWLVLVISAVGNMVASYSGSGTPVHLVCGAVTALCVTALVVQRLRGRR